MTTSDPLLPATTELRRDGPGTQDAIEAVQELTRRNLTITEIVRLCGLKPGTHSTVVKIRDGTIRGVRPPMARAIVEGHERYQAGDRSYIRQSKSKAPKNRVDLHLGPKRKAAQKPEPTPEPGPLLTSPGLRERLAAARREGRRT